MRDSVEERNASAEQIVETQPIVPTIEDPCAVCGAESEYGINGIRGDHVYHEYLCGKCYHQGKRAKGTITE